MEDIPAIHCKALYIYMIKIHIQGNEIIYSAGHPLADESYNPKSYAQCCPHTRFGVNFKSHSFIKIHWINICTIFNINSIEILQYIFKFNT